MFDFTDTLPLDSKKNSVLPKGIYKIIVEKAELKSTKALDGKYINLQLSVTDGVHTGRKVFDLINIENQNPETVSFGKRKVVSLLSGAGLPQKQWKINSVLELEGLSCFAEVGIKANGSYGDKNVVYNYTSSMPSGVKSPEADVKADELGF